MSLSLRNIVWCSVLLFLILFVAFYLFDNHIIHQQISFSPRLVEGNYKGFNIFEYMGFFYGLNRAENPMIIREIHTRAKFLWVSDEAIGRLKLKIDKFDRQTK